MAIGVYLRKAVIDNMQNEVGVVIEVAPFGKFTLLPDPEANYTLYPKKILFEPNAAIANGTYSS